jgi:hypothetical protein
MSGQKKQMLFTLIKEKGFINVAIVVSCQRKEA